jgi:hypothetical protein
MLQFSLEVPAQSTDCCTQLHSVAELQYHACCRHRRRSGSSIVVVDTQDLEPVKHRTPEEQEAEDAYNMMTMTLDNGPHREMAVDVPDSFIASSKTPPRYPPPRSQGRSQVRSHLILVAVYRCVW